MPESIKQILMRRDNMSARQAEELITEASKTMFDYLDSGDDAAAENICMEYFGLEPDYIMELF